MTQSVIEIKRCLSTDLIVHGKNTSVRWNTRERDSRSKFEICQRNIPVYVWRLSVNCIPGSCYFRVIPFPRNLADCRVRRLSYRRILTSRGSLRPCSDLYVIQQRLPGTAGKLLVHRNPLKSLFSVTDRHWRSCRNCRVSVYQRVSDGKLALMARVLVARARGRKSTEDRVLFRDRCWNSTWKET